MPYATNRFDGKKIYFEEEQEQSGGVPVVFLGGALDSVPLVRTSPLASGLRQPGGEFRLIYMDHRGVGRSDKPHDPKAYSMPVRALDPIGVLDKLGIERAHFIGTSWGGRICFGIGEYAPERVLSLVIGGQHPYVIDIGHPASRAVNESLHRSREVGSLEPFVEALEKSSGLWVPEPRRSLYLENDPIAVATGSDVMVAEGPVCRDLRSWQIPCLIWAGEEDPFHDQGQRAASEIPNARFVSLPKAAHLGAHLAQDRVLPAVLDFLKQV